MTGEEKFKREKFDHCFQHLFCAAVLVPCGAAFCAIPFLREEIFVQLLSFGSVGAEVSLLQLGLNRALALSIAQDGIFGNETRDAVLAFQRANGLVPDGVAGPRTEAALAPWYAGYAVHTIAPGDTLWRLSVRYDTTLSLLETANPSLDPFQLRIGSRVIVPFNFPVVPTTIPWCSELLGYCVEGLAARYPAVRAETIGRSVRQKPLWSLRFGTGARRVLYNAAHHANEWITVPLLMRYTEEVLSANARGEAVFGVPAEELLFQTSFAVVPCVNPDGMDLVTRALPESDRAAAAAIAARYPSIPFPDGWKANLRGVDPNLQYPAGWEEARAIKYAAGYTTPAPRDFVGNAPLSIPESTALADYIVRFDPALMLAYHTQGDVIYWKYLDREPEGSRALAERFSAVSGYAIEDVPYASAFAGCKDWFIAEFDRPGYTIEAGQGENPLPLSEFERIYEKNRGILTAAAMG